MSSRTLLAQDDFSSVWLAAGQDSDSQPLDYFNEITTANRAASGDSPKSESSCETDKIYRPVDFIPDEAHELIRIWELAYRTKQERADAVDSIEIESVTYLQTHVFEPIRCISGDVFPPPKKFHRTFWRSLTRRMVQRMETSAVSCSASAAMSNAL
jgi:hypothetical protein